MIAGLAMPAQADVAVWLECRPALPFYCANIHVGCAGRSRVPTAPFTLAFADGATIHRDREVPQAASVTHSTSGTVVRPDGSLDWIRVQVTKDKESFAFSQRIYQKGRALMTHGTCRHAPRDVPLPRTLTQ